MARRPTIVAPPNGLSAAAPPAPTVDAQVASSPDAGMASATPPELLADALLSPTDNEVSAEQELERDAENKDLDGADGDVLQPPATFNTIVSDEDVPQEFLDMLKQGQPSTLPAPVDVVINDNVEVVAPGELSEATRAEQEAGRKALARRRG